MWASFMAAAVGKDVRAVSALRLIAADKVL